MMHFLETLKAELRMTFTDKAIILTIVGGVILYSFLYPQPYANQSVSSLNVAVVDYDKSDVSRDMIFKLDATPQISIIHRDMSERDAKEALVRGEVKAIIIIPRHFRRDLALNKSPTIAVGADSSYFLIYGGVLEGAMKSVLTQSAAVKVGALLKREVPFEHAKKAYASYSLQVINLFNINNSYTQYVVPAVFVLILQQTLLIGMGILGGGINERLRNGERGYFCRAPLWQIFLSRYLIFGSIFFVHMLFYFGFSYELFDVTRLASIPELLKFGIAFLMATLSFGIFLGALFDNREIATPAVLFSSLPLVFSAGFVWPVEAIPSSIYYLSHLVPSTPAIHGFLQLNHMGADFDMVSKSYTLLLIDSIVYLILGYLISRRKRRRCENDLRI